MTQRYPTNLAPLPGQLAYAQGLDLERWLGRTWLPWAGLTVLSAA